jgi:ketosteroid isomerase-like protein
MKTQTTSAAADLDALREANERFYRALESLDLDAMDRLWLHEGWVHCVHPGWDAVTGGEAVRASWQQIFANTLWIRVTATAVRLEIAGDLGIVACAENITAKSGEDVGLAVAQATNIFRRTPEGWRMIHHHASSAPVHVTHPFSGTVQ